ncbi:MAG: aminotransferase class IV, partial [Kofleriaceae bacterium]
VSIDGVIVAPEQATISVFDRGLLYGDGCFEVLRTWNGVAVDLDRHLDRLEATARVLSLHVPARAVLTGWVRQAVHAAGDEDLRIRIVVTRGPGPLSARLAALGAGRCIVIVEPLLAQSDELSLAFVDWPIAHRAGPGHKTLAYLDHVLAREHARAAGADDAIRLDHAGHVVEGGTCNVFVVARGVVSTPPIDAGVLPGIVRAHVLALCDQLTIRCTAQQLTVADVVAAEEVFATSSLRGIAAVTRLDGRERARGPITARLGAAYRSMQRARATGVLPST